MTDPSRSAAPTPSPLPFAAGDLIVQRGDDGLWTPAKILCIDAWPDDGTSTVHGRFYRRTAQRPASEALAALPVHIAHAPVDGTHFATGWEHVGHAPVAASELDAFFDYLRRTDFPRYLQVTRQDGTAFARAANAHFQQAVLLSEQGLLREAIAEYGRAIDSFPLFFEAIDNRAFICMELGNFRAALEGFEHSLRVHPAGATAFFSKGECLLRLRELGAAEAVFAAGLERFPAARANFAKYLEMTQALRRRREAVR